MHTPEPAAAKTSRKATKPPVAEAETSDRGLLVKEIGEVAGLGDSPVEAMAEFTVDSIEVAGACTSEIAEEPENGYFVMVTITATVQPGFAEWFEAESGWAGGMPFDTYSFGLIDADGVVVNAPDTWGALSCLADADMMPDEVTDGKTATGTVVLDSPTPSGVVTFQPTGVEGGWEWEF